MSLTTTSVEQTSSCSAGSCTPLLQEQRSCVPISQSSYSCTGPSLGMTLVFSILGFGTDRFYVGQTGLGIAFMAGYLSIIGLVVVIPAQIIAQISLLLAIFTNRNTSFMYGSNVVFEPPGVVDKIIAITWVVIIAIAIIVSAVVIFV